MLKKAFQFLLFVIGSYYTGLIFGILAGTMFGAVLGLFFKEIVYSFQTVLMSILFAVFLGGFLGWLAILAERRYVNAQDLPGLGMLLGVVTAIIVILGYGVIVILDPQVFDDTFYATPMIYGAGVGQTIGSLDCVLIGLFLGIRGLIQNRPSKADKQEFNTYSDFFRKQLKK